MKSNALFFSPKFLKRLGKEAVDREMIGGRRPPLRSGMFRPNTIQAAREKPGVLPVAHEDNPILYRIRASWLTDLFPDELLIQEKTICIIHHSFFVQSAETLPVKDIGRVVLVDTPLFDGIRILGKNVAHDLEIRGLNKYKARRAKEIIEELMLEEHSEIQQWLSNEERSEHTPYIGLHEPIPHEPHYEPQLEKRPREQ